MEIGLAHYLGLSAFLLAAGVFTILSRRNAIVILMGVELVLNAAALNFVAFGRYGHGTITGQAMAVFIIVIAAAEAAVALAIILSIFRNFNTVNVDQVDRLRHERRRHGTPDVFGAGDPAAPGAELPGALLLRREAATPR